MPARRYSIIFGSGRSGTSWLLDLFHTSPETLCRSSPYSIPGSPFTSLEPHRAVIDPDSSELRKSWDDVVTSTLKSMGPRDPYFLLPKDYLGRIGSAIGGRLLSKKRLRNTMGVFFPDLSNDEWAIPRWMGNRALIAKAPAVIKLLQSPGFSSFVLKDRPKVPVFQIVRHPGGYLNSWSNRYLKSLNTDEVLRANRELLQQIAAVDPIWGARFGDMNALGVEEAELWYWRYSNESSFELAQGRTHCRVFSYEELVADPLLIMKDLFRIAELEWTETVAQRILALSTQSAEIASKWKDRLQTSQVELVERVMESSPLQKLWA